MVRDEEALEQAFRSHFSAMVFAAHAAADALGLHPTDLFAANLVDLFGPLTAGEIADRTGISTGAATRLIDRLERAGVVERRADPADRRRVVVAKASDRDNEFDRVLTPLAVHLDEVFSTYSAEEVAILCDFFTRSSAVLGRAGEEIRTKREDAEA